jgi:hypothetical protein
MRYRAFAGGLTIMSVHIFFSDCGCVDWTVLETVLETVLGTVPGTVVLTRGADVASAPFRLRWNGSSIANLSV